MISYPVLLRTYRTLSIYVKNRSMTIAQPNINQSQSLLLPAGMQARQAHTDHDQNTATALFNDPHKHIDYDQLITKQKNQAAVVVDVREPEELAETGTIPGSIHIPLGQVEQALQLNENEFQKKYHATKPGKDALIIFSCRSGKRSKDALFKALLHGYENSESYSGGWLDWESKTKVNQ